MIRTAVDSSVLLDVFSADSQHGAASQEILRKCWSEGGLVACEVVWAEIRPRFSSDAEVLKITDKIGLGFDSLLREAALLAGTIWKKYHEKGGKRDRMIPDFLIAAHAQLQTDRFLTRDRGFYRTYFPSLTILEP